MAISSQDLWKDERFADGVNGLKDGELAGELKKRANSIRRLIVKTVHTARSGHYGGSMSIADILAVLYFHEMRIKPGEPQWADRDRLVLSKGHGAPALYATLALRGFFPIPELATLRQIGSILQGHPDMRKTPGVDYTAGSLGHGLGIAAGMAMGAKLENKAFRTFAIVGDGEIQEGSIWEAAMSAPKFRLNNLVVIVDHNRLQVEGRVKDIMPVAPVTQKWTDFGWDVLETDGHDMEALLAAFAWARKPGEAPRVIVANTIKGRGVSFMEDRVNWHKGDLDAVTFELALQELEQHQAAIDAGGQPGH